MQVCHRWRRGPGRRQQPAPNKAPSDDSQKPSSLLSKHNEVKDQCKILLRTEVLRCTQILAEGTPAAQTLGVRAGAWDAGAAATASPRLARVASS